MPVKSMDWQYCNNNQHYVKQVLNNSTAASHSLGLVFAAKQVQIISLLQGSIFHHGKWHYDRDTLCHTKAYKNQIKVSLKKIIRLQLCCWYCGEFCMGKQLASIWWGIHVVSACMCVFSVHAIRHTFVLHHTVACLLSKFIKYAIC